MIGRSGCETSHFQDFSWHAKQTLQPPITNRVLQLHRVRQLPAVRPLSKRTLAIRKTEYVRERDSPNNTAETEIIRDDDAEACQKGGAAVDRIARLTSDDC